MYHGLGTDGRKIGLRAVDSTDFDEGEVGVSSREGLEAEGAEAALPVASSRVRTRGGGEGGGVRGGVVGHGGGGVGCAWGMTVAGFGDGVDGLAGVFDGCVAAELDGLAGAGIDGAGVNAGENRLADDVRDDHEDDLGL